MKLFVGGVSWNVEEDQLKELFSKFGEVASVKIIIDRETGKSKGFGFVEMPNDEEAKSAIAGLNDTQLDGKNIGVNVAEEKKPREGGFKKDFKRRDNNRDNNRGGGGNRW